MNITGSCHCQQLTYQAVIDPLTVRVCHCHDCQKSTGSAFRVNVTAARDGFIMVGEPSIYVKIADSGTARAQAFCPTCGSHLYTYSVDNPEIYGLRVGCIDQRHELIPHKQIFGVSSLGWTQNMHTLPMLERY